MTHAFSVHCHRLGSYGLLLAAFATTASGCDDGLQQRLEDARAALSESALRVRELDSSYATAQAMLEKQTVRLERVPGALDLKVAFEFAGAALELEQPYALRGATVSISSVRYWLTNLALRDLAGEWVAIPDSYYLMEHTTKYVATAPDEGEYVPKLRDTVAVSDVPAGTYGALRLCVGVDAEHNDDLSMTGGELNVLSNMAKSKWMWYTSYVFTSLYGQLTPSTFGADDEPIAFSWRTGGNEWLRCTEVELPNAVQVAFERRTAVELVLDTSRVFDDMAELLGPEASSGQDSYIGASEEEDEEDEEDEAKKEKERSRSTILADNWRDTFSVRSACCGPSSATPAP